MSTKISHKPIRIEARIKNNVLYQAVHQMAKSVRVFCKSFDLAYPTVVSLINLQLSPHTKKGYRDICLRLSTVTGIAPDVLFPEELYQLESTKAVREYSFSELPAAREKLMLLEAPDSPFEDVATGEMKKFISDYLAILLPTERRVLELFYGVGKPEDERAGDMTLGQIADILGLTRERVRQIREKAIERLRRYDRHSRHILADFASDPLCR